MNWNVIVCLRIHKYVNMNYLPISDAYFEILKKKVNVFHLLNTHISCTDQLKTIRILS
jgi:hypothetical protein